MNNIENRQCTNTVVMVSPDQFGFNPQTAASNVFQHDLTTQGRTEIEVRDAALAEFNIVVQTLRANDIDVAVLPSPKAVITPDAVFPNNWFSHHQDGILVVYPMLTENRRAERQTDALVEIIKAQNASVTNIIDLTDEENHGSILEGTGSLVLDRVHKVAFAMASPRTNEITLKLWCEKMGYEPFYFHAFDAAKTPIYHTNVAMNLGDKFVVACPEAINDEDERQRFLDKLKALEKELIPISLEQVYQFCGNVLQLQSKNGESKIIMSTTAFTALTDQQKQNLSKYGELLAVSIPTIEAVGGGGARCMLAEIFPRAL